MRLRSPLVLAALLALSRPLAAQTSTSAKAESLHVKQTRDTATYLARYGTNGWTRRMASWLVAQENAHLALVRTRDTILVTKTDTVQIVRVDTVYRAPCDTCVIQGGEPKPDTTTAPPPRPDTVVTQPPPAPSPAPGPIVSSHPYAPPSNGALLAELPRDTVRVAPLPILRTIAVSNLQAALDTARVGDLLVAPQDAVFRNVVVRRSGVTIRTAGFTATDARMTPAQAAALRLAHLSTASSTPALTITNGVQDVRLEGLRVTSSYSGVNALVVVGPGTSDSAQVPKRIVFKNVAVDCGATNDTRRGIRFDGAHEAFMDGSVVNCHSNNGDSQGILAINTPGPIRIENSRIEGGHMAIMFGGGDPAIQGVVPSDIVVRRNWLGRPASWKGVWGTKNIIEHKIGRRALWEGNVIANVWPDGQTGFAWNLKSTNQDGTAPWSQTSDVTVRWNKVTCAAGVFSLAGSPDEYRNGVRYPAVPMSRITIYGNVADSIGIAPCQGQAQGAVLWMGVSDVVFRDNWVRDPEVNAAIYGVGCNARAFVTGNVIGGQYGIRGESGWSTTCGGSVITENTVVPWPTPASAWPALPADSTRDALLGRVP